MSTKQGSLRQSDSSFDHHEDVSTDAWREESSRQAQRLAVSVSEGPSLFAEFRRKLATGEALSRALEKLAEAVRFSGRITVTFHQGKRTKTTLEESYFSGKAGM